jgi:hypothetical protein
VNTVESKIDTVRRRTADTLESAADSVRSAGDQSGNAINDAANNAGGKLDSAAAFVRALPGRRTMAGLRQTIRRNPMGSLLFATAVGIVAGMACRQTREVDKREAE